MRTLLSVLLSTVTGLALISAAAPARAQTVYPRCAVVTTNGGGTLDPGRTGIGFGTGTLTMEAEYADATNAVPTFFDYEYTNNARYQRGATSANYETMMTVNGAPQNVSPHLNYPVNYFLHGTWAGVWGSGRPLTKGDVVTIRVVVEMFPTLNSGWTEGTCIL